MSTPCIQFIVNEDEHELLQRTAKMSGFTDASQYVKALALDSIAEAIDAQTLKRHHELYKEAARKIRMESTGGKLGYVIKSAVKVEDE